jgi:tRNA pseudouridine55 synthase
MTRRKAAPGAPEGGLVVDKTAGLTSHDVVALARRALGQPRIGHTGTLDPMATGVLVLLLGRATRLAQFLALDDKAYDATVDFGQATSTYDAEGAPVGPRSEMPVERDALEAALATFRGAHLQAPPAVSAKKVKGHRAYDLVRAAAPVTLAPVAVELHQIDVVAFDGRQARLRVACSAGFYVRALAHELGQQLGMGAHLHALRRVRSGRFGLEQAVSIEALATRPLETVASRLVTSADLVGHLTTIVAAGEGLERLARGRDLAPAHVVAGTLAATGQARVLDESGRLLAVGTLAPGLLHPVVVLM